MFSGKQIWLVLALTSLGQRWLTETHFVHLKILEIKYKKILETQRQPDQDEIYESLCYHYSKTFQRLHAEKKVEYNFTKDQTIL